MTFWKILTLIGIIVLAFWLISYLRTRPAAVFSRESWSRSFFTMGILALLLIGFITLCVAFLRNM